MAIIDPTKVATTFICDEDMPQPYILKKIIQQRRKAVIL
jgi:hypothetical protein